MNMLLVTPYVAQEHRNPIAALDLAQYYRQHYGHTVTVVYDDMVESVGYNSFDLVGVSVLHGDAATVMGKVTTLRSHFPRARFIVGGKATRTWSKEELQQYAYQHVDVSTHEGELVFTSHMIDWSAYPAWSLLDFRSLGRQMTGDLMTSRGCPFHCHYCHNTERGMHFFSPQRTAMNVRLLKERGVSQFFFVDDIFTLKPAHMEGVLSALKAENVFDPHSITFFTHVNCIRSATLKLMTEYKPACVQIGLESGDDNMLRLMNKPFTAEESGTVVRQMHERGIPTVGLFLLGYPGETQFSLRRTMQFADRIRPYVQGMWVSYYQPIPNTVGHSRAVERGFAGRGARNTDKTFLDPALTWAQLDEAKRHISQ